MTSSKPIKARARHRPTAHSASEKAQAVLAGKTG